jgi:hypothetical protein
MASRSIIDASAGGSIIELTPTQAFTLFKKVADNDAWALSRRLLLVQPTGNVKWVLQVEKKDLFESKIYSLPLCRVLANKDPCRCPILLGAKLSSYLHVQMLACIYFLDFNQFPPRRRLFLIPWSPYSIISPLPLSCRSRPCQSRPADLLCRFSFIT